MATKREKREQRFRDARQRAETHDSGGRSSLRLPDGVSLFQVKSRDVKRIEVIPYEVARDNVNPNCPEAGYLYHERTFFVHRDVGGSGETYVCPSKTFKKPCPVCEYRGKLAKDPEADEQVIKDMAPKERQLFNVYDHAEPDKGVQIWDISYHLFGKSLDTRIKAPDAEEDDDYAQFAHPESGMTVRITPEEKKMGSNTFFDCSGIEFRPRKRPLSEEILSGAHDLDSLIKEVSYADLKKVLFQTPADDEDDKPTANGRKPARGKPAPDDEDDEDDDDEEPAKPVKGKGKMPTAAEFGIKVGDLVVYKAEECEVVKISPDGTSLTLETEDGDTFRAVGPEEVKLAKGKPAPDDDDEDEPAKPAKGKKVPPPAKGKKAPDPDEEEDEWDDEDDEEDDEEPVKSAKDKKAPPPAKGKPAIADDDWDEDEDDEEEPAKPAKGKATTKPAKGKATTKPADDDDWDEDDEDEDDEPVKPAKPAKGKAVKGKGK